jgi:DNA-binding MarR family transcriptional regulator
MRTRAKDKLHRRAPRLNHLLVLKLVAASARCTQAEIARRLQLSVAMVNNYMKELCAAGLLEYRRKSARVVSYHLTAAGDVELQRMSHEWIHEMVRLFAQAKETLRDAILAHAPGKLQRVVLFGSGDLAELVFHALESNEVRVIGVCDSDPERIGLDWCGREVLNPSQIRYMAPDAVIIVDPQHAAEVAHSLRHLVERGTRLIRLDAGHEPAAPTHAPAEGLLTGTGEPL